MNDKVKEDAKKLAETAISAGQEVVKTRRMRILVAILIVMTIVLAVVVTVQQEQPSRKAASKNPVN